MRVHVTGGTGFLGKRVVPRLIGRGHEVSALARTKSSADLLRRLGARAIDGDLDDPAQTERAFAASGSVALMNLASLGFGHAPGIVSAAERAGLRRAIFVSTTAIFTTLDPRSKAVRLEAEQTIRASSLDWTIIRPTMIYGAPDDRNMIRLLRFIRRWPIVPVPGGGTRLQQPVHVDDLADVIVAALERPSTRHKAFDVAGPEPLTLREVITQSANALQKRITLMPVPLTLLTALARVYERGSSKPSVRAEQLARLAEDKAFDIGPARTELGFDPRPFRAGIDQEAALLR